MEYQVKEILALAEGEDIKKKELTNEDATKLLSLAKVDGQESEIIYLLDIIDSIANAGPTTRAALSAGLSTHSLLSLLSHPSPSVISQALKTIGTIAFDIQAKKILVEQGIVNLSLDLAKSKEPAVSFRATELIGHICFGSEGTCESYLSSPSSLSSLLSLASESSNPDTKYSAIRAIGSMSEKTANQNKIAHQGGLEFLITELNKATEKKEKDETLLYELIRSLSMLVQLNPPHVKQATKGLQALINTVSHFYRISASQSLSISLSENGSRPEYTKSPDLVASDLLVVLADDETLRPAFMENGIFLELLNLLELPIGNVRVTRNILKIFARVSVNDGCMQKLMGHTTTVLKMLKQDDVEVQLAAILVIGNLARSEENVTKLIQTGVVDTLLNFIKENSATNTPLTHVCANVLRNFSISAQNKKRLGETQVIPTLMYLANFNFEKLFIFYLKRNLLAHSNPLVQFAAVVALKNLLLNCAPNLDVLLKENGLPALIKLANDRGVLSENEDETEEEKIQNADKRIQYECTRVLVKLTERDDLLKEIVKEKGIRAILVMMGCEHDVLRLEASQSLSLISSKDEYRPAIIEASGGAEGLVKIFSQHDDIVQAIQANEDFQWNIAQIFKNLARNDQSRTALLAANIVPVLKTISKSASAKCKPVFIEALSTLTC